MERVTVCFLPSEKKVEAVKGANLIDVAMDAGVHINAACGGEGACGKCRVLIKSGEVDCQDCTKISPEDYKKGYRQACHTAVLSDVEVLIPAESQLNLSEVKGTRTGAQAGREAVLEEIEKRLSGPGHVPGVQKLAVEVAPPTLEDNTSDLSRLLRALKQQHGLENVSTDSQLLYTLSKALRKADWKATVTVVQARMESPPSELPQRGSQRPQLVSVEPGDTTDKHYSVVMDIGTTSLWGQLIDLNTREILAQASEYNPQVSFGDDVITRIVYSQKPGGLKKLQEVVVEGLNKIIGELIDKTGVEKQHISHMTAAGNTVMTHLLAGLDPKYIRETPYTPVAGFLPPLRAIRLGLDVAEHVYIYTFPSVASYVGGDIVSGVLCSGMYQQSELTLYIDIGTNGEIVVGNSDWLMTASCSAGPAFEGGGLRFGMRAAAGAIERFRINPDTLEPMVVTIDKAKARGICGSGAINIMAEFLRTGVLDQNGKFNCSCRTPRIREGQDGREYVLVYKEDIDTSEDIVITESDIDNLTRAKAAMFAGYQSLLDKVGLTFPDLDRVMIAGAFGDFINLEEAITIGLLPELPMEKYIFIGNGSLLGARLISLSSQLSGDGELIASKMTNIELSEDRSFMDRYMAGMFLPHTDAGLFPKATEMITSGEKTC